VPDQGTDIGKLFEIGFPALNLAGNGGIVSPVVINRLVAVSDSPARNCGYVESPVARPV
jgi:hypothetical protein